MGMFGVRVTALYPFLPLQLPCVRVAGMPLCCLCWRMLCSDLWLPWVLVQHRVTLPWARPHPRYLGAVSLLQLVQAVPDPACTSLETSQHTGHLLVVQAVLIKALMAINLIPGSTGLCAEVGGVRELYLCVQEPWACDTWEPPQRWNPHPLPQAEQQ